jgi:predicted DNA-binding ribbon-helix-helix protein
MHRTVERRDIGQNRSTAMVKKRSVVVQEHRTSVSLEDVFWDSLKEIALSRETGVSELVNAINAERRPTNLSSAIRLFVLDHYRVGAGQVVDSVSAVER